MLTAVKGEVAEAGRATEQGEQGEQGSSPLQGDERPNLAAHPRLDWGKPSNLAPPERFHVEAILN